MAEKHLTHWPLWVEWFKYVACDHFQCNTARTLQCRVTFAIWNFLLFGQQQHEEFKPFIHSATTMAPCWDPCWSALSCTFSHVALFMETRKSWLHSSPWNTKSVLFEPEQLMPLFLSVSRGNCWESLLKGILQSSCDMIVPGWLAVACIFPSGKNRVQSYPIFSMRLIILLARWPNPVSISHVWSCGDNMKPECQSVLYS